MPQMSVQRSRPRSTVEFDPPIEGPTGMRLVAYTWQWRPMESVDARGEDRVVRVSDWDRAEPSAETGREIVHQFVVDDGGASLLVSAESAVKLLGFAPDSEASAGVRSVATAAKALARLRMGEAALQQRRGAFDRVAAEVAAIPLPPMPSERVSIGGLTGWWVLGDARVRQIEDGPMTDERRRCLIESWRDNRFRERGCKHADEGRDIDRELVEIGRRAFKAEKKLMSMVVFVSDATAVPGGHADRGCAMVGPTL